MKTQRTTEQKKIIYDVLMSQNTHLQADEVYHHVHKKNPNISKATVYRNLNKMAQSGEIRKIEVCNDADYYDPNTYRHLHAVCTSCGMLYDIPYRESLIPQLNEEKDLGLTGFDLVFRGLCSKCHKEENENG